MGANNCSQTHTNLIKYAHFPKSKSNISTCVYKTGHNFTCDQYFIMKLTPLDSVHTELSIHAKNSIFMKYPESLFSEQVTNRVHLKQQLQPSKLAICVIIFMPYFVVFLEFAHQTAREGTETARSHGIRRSSHGNVMIPHMNPLPTFAQC